MPVIPEVDDTHDPRHQSWVDSANDPATDFPLQNLPFGVFRTPDDCDSRIGVAIGSAILDVGACAADGLLVDTGHDFAGALVETDLTPLMSLAPAARRSIRQELHALLRDTASTSKRTRTTAHLVDRSTADLLLPARIGDFCDYFASRAHAANVAAIVADLNVPESYAHLPLGSQGRAASIIVSPNPVRRPHGQRRTPDGYRFALSRRLDFELEAGLFVGPGTGNGKPIPIDSAQAHLFGLCLLNDWSARDVQALESYPLGPFLSKSFATSISPWIITAEALAPFRVPLSPEPERDRELPPYLDCPDDRATGAIAVVLEVTLSTARMRERGIAPEPVVRSNLETLHWTPGQLIAHHTSNGSALWPGDLIGTGTVSGHTPETGGSLLELTRGGRTPLQLPGGETRGFLEDSDEVIIRGWCEAPGMTRIGFGQCRGRVLPPHGH
jgi:fumarylacetoacetase